MWVNSWDKEMGLLSLAHCRSYSLLKASHVGSCSPWGQLCSYLEGPLSDYQPLTWEAPLASLWLPQEHLSASLWTPHLDTTLPNMLALLPPPQMDKSRASFQVFIIEPEFSHFQIIFSISEPSLYGSKIK